MGGVKWRWWWWWCVVVMVLVVMQSVVSTPVVMNEDTHAEEWRQAAMRGQETIEEEPVEMKEKKEEEEEMKPRRGVEKNVEKEEEVGKWRTRTEMIAERRLVEEMSRRRRPQEKMEGGQKMIKVVEMDKEEEEEEEKIVEDTRQEQKISRVKEKMEKMQEMITKQTEGTEKRINHGEDPEKTQVEMIGRLETSEAEQQEMIHPRRLQEKIKEAREEEKQHLEGRRYLEIRRKLVKEEDLPVLSLHPQEVDIISGESHTFEISLSEDPAECLNVTLALDPDLGTVAPSFVVLCNATTDTAEPPNTTLTTLRHGTATLTATATPEGLVQYESGENAFSVVSVMKSKGITTTADVLGWIYTIAWDVSFLPQIFRNWQRKSVVGLSFDFLTFNFIGFASYLMFNAGMFWIPAIQDQYEERHPQSILHVRLNDVIFPLYALVCTAGQILQCFFYKRAEGQRISLPCLLLSGLLLLAIVVGCILVPVVEDWWWIDELYLLSYVKLAITCIKYIPQLYVNYSHRSTEAWSIYQVLLDFTGGVLSLVQMFLLSANYDDWESLLTDPAKLGLGLLSIFFNVLFFIQHFCLYRNAPSQEKPLKGSVKGEDGPMVILEGPRSSPAPLETSETGLGKEEEEEEEERREEEEKKKKEEEEEEKKKQKKKEEEEEEKERRREEEKKIEARREERDEEAERKEDKEEEPGVVITGEEKKSKEEEEKV